MESQLLSRVRKSLNQRRIPWARVAALSGVDYYTVMRIATGKTKSPRIMSLENIARVIERETA